MLQKKNLIMILSLRSWFPYLKMFVPKVQERFETIQQRKKKDNNNILYFTLKSLIFSKNSILFCNLFLWM